MIQKISIHTFCLAILMTSDKQQLTICNKTTECFMDCKDILLNNFQIFVWLKVYLLLPPLLCPIPGTGSPAFLKLWCPLYKSPRLVILCHPTHHQALKWQSVKYLLLQYIILDSKKQTTIENLFRTQLYEENTSLCLMWAILGLLELNQEK